MRSNSTRSEGALGSGFHLEILLDCLKASAIYSNRSLLHKFSPVNVLLGNTHVRTCSCTRTRAHVCAHTPDQKQTYRYRHRCGQSYSDSLQLHEEGQGAPESKIRVWLSSLTPHCRTSAEKHLQKVFHQRRKSNQTAAREDQDIEGRPGHRLIIWRIVRSKKGLHCVCFSLCF